MPLSTIIFRPINLLFRSQDARAASQHTSNWGLKRLMARPETHDMAFKTALEKVHNSPKLAMFVLTGNFTPAEKEAVVKRVIDNLDFSTPELSYPNCTSFDLAREITARTPRFIKLLAEQPEAVVAAAHALWVKFLPPQTRPPRYDNLVGLNGRTIVHVKSSREPLPGSDSWDGYYRTTYAVIGIVVDQSWIINPAKQMFPYPRFIKVSEYDTHRVIQCP